MSEPASAVSERSVPPGAAVERFEEFFDRHHPRLLRALFLVTGNEQEAEEIMQDAFLAVWERWDRVSDMEDPAGYLYRTAMNRFRSRWRRSVRAARESIRLVPSGDAFAEAEERDAVSRALASVTPRQRAALVLTEYLGYGSEEAGRILGVTAATVRALASQGRAAMKQKLESSDE